MVNIDIIKKIKNKTLYTILASCHEGSKIKKQLNEIEYENKKIKINDILVDPAIDMIAREVIKLETEIENLNKKLDEFRHFK